MLVEPLVPRGYLERAVDSNDRHKMTVALTEHGGGLTDAIVFGRIAGAEAAARARAGHSASAA